MWMRVCACVLNALVPRWFTKFKTACCQPEKEVPEYPGKKPMKHAHHLIPGLGGIRGTLGEPYQCAETRSMDNIEHSQIYNSPCASK